MQPHLHRVEVQRAVARDHDLPVERRVGREQLSDPPQLGEVAQQRAAVPRPQCELAAVVLEHATEAVPLGLVAPCALLGLYRDDGRLDYVGSCAVGAKNQQEIAAKVLPLLDEQSDRRFSEPNRWGTGELEETPLKPELVVEVRYDKLEKSRFRHGTKLVRFRPDKDAAQCTWREVRPPRHANDPTFESLLGRARV